MRRLLLSVILILSVLPLMGQDYMPDELYPGEELAMAFTAEGRKHWKPELTFRIRAGIYNGGMSLSGGARIDSKRTLGLMIGQGNTFVDAAPGHIKRIQTGAYFRRYSHLGRRDIIAFYNDFCIGAQWVYSVSGNTRPSFDNGEEEVIFPDKPGDAALLLSWQPGIRLRLFRNVHIFLGPNIGTDCLGVHLGLGI